MLCTGADGSDAHKQARLCVTVREILTRAGLSDDPGVRPASLTAYAARRDFDRAGRIEDATPSCGTVHRERIDTTDRDRKRGYNRAEHLRQHIKTDDGDSVYDRCYGWREDSESLNNILDRTLYGGHMIGYSAVRQLTVMVGFALGRNGIAAYLHRRRKPDQATA